ncbi:MAG: molybdopterin-dependent oxidoreductase [Candidatus Promineifilaceae bacterium]|nr:molybdopterin-dependent oxidoreductase [Candidatus Promineifilaceae bacterium]
MRKANVALGALVGGMVTAALIGLSFLGREALGLPFVPYDLFNWVARELPGSIITFGIDAMIDTLRLLGISVVDAAKTAERIIAVIQFLLGGVVAGALFFSVLEARARRMHVSPGTGLLLGVLFGLPLVAISLAISQAAVSPIVHLLYLAALFLGWGAALALAYNRLTTPAEAPAPPPAPPEAAALEAAPTVEGAAAVEKIDRRSFLIRLGAATATITVVGGGVGAVLATAERRREAALAAADTTSGVGPRGTPFPNTGASVVPVPGTRPEYTPVEDHYQVFLRTEPTVIDGASWVLPIAGMVDNPLLLDLDALRNNYEPRDQYVTLTCISGRVGTELISTTLWTGASVQEVLADAGVQDGARYLFIESGDGFYETVDLDLIAADERIMFCYAWDGRPLPVDHGFPLRIWIPDRYGMKQPKWITSIEVTDEYRDGYWVERNWDRVARVKATSVVDTVAVDRVLERGGQRFVPVGGIAYAGARGISRVEVRVDGGAWQPAQLRTPLSETTWVIWRYEWPFAEGRHTFEVRCAEGDGTPQIEERSGARPDGSTGIHSRDARL